MDGEEIGERRGFLASNHGNLPQCFPSSSREEETMFINKKKKVGIHGGTIGAAFLPPREEFIHFPVSVSDIGASILDISMSFPPRNLDKCFKLRVELL